MERHAIADFDADYMEERGLQPWFWRAECLCKAKRFSGKTIRLSGAMVQAKGMIYQHALEEQPWWGVS